MYTEPEILLFLHHFGSNTVSVKLVACNAWALCFLVLLGYSWAYLIKGSSPLGQVSVQSRCSLNACCMNNVNGPYLTREQMLSGWCGSDHELRQGRKWLWSLDGGARVSLQDPEPFRKGTPLKWNTCCLAAGGSEALYNPCSPFSANQNLHSWSSCCGQIQYCGSIVQVLQTASH